MAKTRKPAEKARAKPPGSGRTPVKRSTTDSRLEALYLKVHAILTEARRRAWQAVNTAMVQAYWEIGRVIVEEEQAGKGRAEYGKRVLEGLSERLQTGFGQGLDQSN